MIPVMSVVMIGIDNQTKPLSRIEETRSAMGRASVRRKEGGKEKEKLCCQSLDGYT